MAWTNDQKQIAVRACKATAIGEEHRRLILQQFEHAKYGGRVTSTAPRLTNNDFAAFMAIVEAAAGGQVLHFSRGYWDDAASDRLSRMRGKATRCAEELVKAGLLAGNGVGLAGWISKRVSGGTADSVESLDYHGLLALLLGFESYGRQNGLAMQGI